MSLVMIGLAPLPAEAGLCRASTVAIEAGAVIDADNTVPSDCSDASPSPKLRLDRKGGVVRARASLPAGEPVGRVYLAPRPGVLPGDPVALTARIGVVTVSRHAVALQRARPGQRFFARGDDGAVFVAPPVTKEAR